MVEEAESLSRQPANPCTSNPPYCGSIEAPQGSQPMRKPAFTFGGTKSTHLIIGPLMEKIEVPWWVGGGGLDITATSKGSGNKLVITLSLPKGWP